MMIVGIEMTVFLDSNIVLYTLGDDSSKRSIACALLAEKPTISTQVVNECSHVLRRKLHHSPAETGKILMAILTSVKLIEVSIQETYIAWVIAARYKYSHFDSLIIATALKAGCITLYSEDMQHGQVIDGRLTITNPFASVNSL
jgi:predicted nucleic acid-binding protein